MKEILPALVVTTIVALAFNNTRTIGIVGLAILFYIHPLLSSALLLAGGAIYSCVKFFR